ncbi:hypothetical protein HYR99_09555 [Candidatus Poribacteria bacterium]|nr:hypothetical protein [Candidatus Poribacteria bacterium]
MNPRVEFWGICLGLWLVVSFVSLTLFKRKKPPLDRMIALLVSGVGIVSSGYLGYVALFRELGNLKNQQVVLVVGAIAMLYILIETVYKIFFGSDT